MRLGDRGRACAPPRGLVADTGRDVGGRDADVGLMEGDRPAVVGLAETGREANREL